MNIIGCRRSWNKLSELNMIATLKLCAVRVYVTKASVAARTGSEVASAKFAEFR